MNVVDHRSPVKVRCASLLAVFVGCRQEGGLPMTKRASSDDAAIAKTHRPDGAEAPAPLPFESVEYFVEAHGGRSDFLRIEQAGHGVLFRTTSGFAPDVPEVGSYEAHTTAEQVASLVELRAAASAPASPSDPRRPERRVVANERAPNGRLITRSIVFGDGPSRARDALDQMIASAVGRPLRVLHAELDDAHIDASGTFRGTLVLSNRGVSAAVLPFPRPGIDIWPQTRSGADGRPRSGPDRCDGCITALPATSEQPTDAPDLSATDTSSFTLGPREKRTFLVTTSLLSIRLDPHRARLVLESSGLASDDGMRRTARLLSEPVPLDPPPIRTAPIPDPARYVGVSLQAPCGLFSEETALAVLRRARPLVIFDRAREGWTMLPPCNGSAKTTSGPVDFALANGRGWITAKGGPRVNVEWDL